MGMRVCMHAWGTRQTGEGAGLVRADGAGAIGPGAGRVGDTGLEVVEGGAHVLRDAGGGGAAARRGRCGHSQQRRGRRDAGTCFRRLGRVKIKPTLSPCVVPELRRASQAVALAQGWQTKLT